MPATPNYSDFAVQIDKSSLFGYYMTLIYKTRSERQMALVALDALNSLDQLREEKLLSHATYQAVLFELMGFGSAPGVSVSGKPW